MFFNKHRLHFLYVFTGCFLSLMLCGCQNIDSNAATATPQNQTISQFVKNKYTSNFKSFLDALGKSGDINDYTEKLLSDGKSVIYRAFFTTMNDRFLYVPRNDIRSFCEAQQGRLTLQQTFSHSLNGLYQNPTTVFFETLNSNLPQEISVSTNFAGMTITNTYAVDRQQMAAVSAFAASIGNTSPLPQTYVDAVKNGAFGYFRCIHNQHPIWNIIIKPIAFKPEERNNNIFSTNTLYLLISPVEQ
jgi:hypothetical protein